MIEKINSSEVSKNGRVFNLRYLLSQNQAILAQMEREWQARIAELSELNDMLSVFTEEEISAIEINDDGTVIAPVFTG